jgi:hypothetical protein
MAKSPVTKHHQGFLTSRPANYPCARDGEAEVRRALPDRGTPFFLSYARAEDSPSSVGEAHYSDQMAERFFFDLSENVGQLISRRTGADVGFIDTKVQGGMQWPYELLHAAGTCQVLVALLSAPYLSSKWCGIEWCAFSRRTAQRPPGTKPFRREGWIIPVRWAPMPFPLPSPVSEDMIFSPDNIPDPDLPARYRADGVFGLLRTGQEDSYQIIAWQLAKRISKIYHNQRLRSRRFRIEDLENVFQEAAL